MSTPTTRKRIKKINGWAVVDRKVDIYWPSMYYGLYATFPTHSTAKNYLAAEGGNQKIVKCTITYTLPTPKKK